MSSVQPFPSPNSAPPVQGVRTSFAEIANRLAVGACLLAVALGLITVLCLTGATKFTIHLAVFNITVTAIVMLLLPKYASWILGRTLEDRVERIAATNAEAHREALEEVAESFHGQLLTAVIDLAREICHESELRQKQMIKHLLSNALKAEFGKLHGDIGRMQQQIPQALDAATRTGMVLGAQQTPPKPTNGSNLRSVPHHSN